MGAVETLILITSMILAVFCGVLIGFKIAWKDADKVISDLLEKVKTNRV